MLPVFAPEAEEGRLFGPLAWTRTLAMAAAAFLSVTLVPVLMLYFIRGPIRPEAANPVYRALMRRIAAPMIGGMLSSSVLSLRVIPAIHSPIQQAAARSSAQAHDEAR